MTTPTNRFAHRGLPVLGWAAAVLLVADAACLHRFVVRDPCTGRYSHLGIYPVWDRCRFWWDAGGVAPLSDLLMAAEVRQLAALTSLAPVSLSVVGATLWYRRSLWGQIRIRTVLVVTVLVAVGWVIGARSGRRVAAWEAEQVRRDTFCCLDHWIWGED